MGRDLGLSRDAAPDIEGHPHGRQDPFQITDRERNPELRRRDEFGQVMGPRRPRRVGLLQPVRLLGLGSQLIDLGGVRRGRQRLGQEPPAVEGGLPGEAGKHLVELENVAASIRHGGPMLPRCREGPVAAPTVPIVHAWGL